MKTFTLTLEQVITIYNAGISRGESEANAYEWGLRASGNQYDNLVEVLYDFNSDIDPRDIESEIKNEISQQAIRNNK